MENIYKLTTESQLQDQNQLKAMDVFFSSGSEGFFEGKEGIKIYYNYFLQDDLQTENGAIVISSGRTEAAYKYKELIYDLYKCGYSIYIHDHRGQGLSGRIVTSDPELGYVDDFNYFVDDLKTFYDAKVKRNKHNKIFLLAHSMGGAIGALYLENYSEDFDAAFLSSPMLGLGFPTCLVIDLLAGEDPEYAPGEKNYEEGILPFRENGVTNSPIRYQLKLELFEKFPEARLGGASAQWVSRSCEAFDKIFSNLNKIKTPLLLIQGSEDEIIDIDAHNKFVAELKELKINASGFTITGAKHELFFEKDEFRISAITKCLDFFKEF